MQDSNPPYGNESVIKEARARRKRKRTWGVVALTAVLMSVAAAATWAWITASSDPVVNTFTYGDIQIELHETDTGLDNDSDDATNTYKMMPGREITKDPTITVKDGSEACYLFVRLDPSQNLDDFIEYELASGWTQLTNGAAPVEGVYYRELPATEGADVELSVLDDDKVVVKTTVDKDDFEGIGADLPTLSVTAYAVQAEGMDSAYDAWQAVA